MTRVSLQISGAAAPVGPLGPSAHAHTGAGKSTGEELCHTVEKQVMMGLLSIHDD